MRRLLASLPPAFFILSCATVRSLYVSYPVICAYYRSHIHGHCFAFREVAQCICSIARLSHARLFHFKPWLQSCPPVVHHYPPLRRRYRVPSCPVHHLSGAFVSLRARPSFPSWSPPLPSSLPSPLRTLSYLIVPCPHAWSIFVAPLSSASFRRLRYRAAALCHRAAPRASYRCCFLRRCPTVGTVVCPTFTVVVSPAVTCLIALPCRVAVPRRTTCCCLTAGPCLVRSACVALSAPYAYALVSITPVALVGVYTPSPVLPVVLVGARCSARAVDRRSLVLVVHFVPLLSFPIIPLLVPSASASCPATCSLSAASTLLSSLSL